MADALLEEFCSIGQSALARAVLAAIWNTSVQQHLVRNVPWFRLMWQPVIWAESKDAVCMMGHITPVYLRHYGQCAGDLEIAAAEGITRRRAGQG